MVDFEILKWDSDFFHFNVAKISDGCVNPSVFSHIYRELKKKNVKLIYWPSETECSFQHEISSEFHGRLVDIKTTYTKTLRKSDRFIMEDQTCVEFYGNKKADDRMLEIAVQCGEFSRFNSDTDFPVQKFEELYTTWLVKSLSGDLADEVIVTKKDNQVTGLITVKCQNRIGTIGLVGVHDKYRGMGQGGTLMRAALNYFIENKCNATHVVTQGMNHAACSLYEKFGFEVGDKVNFYHFWIK